MCGIQFTILLIGLQCFFREKIWNRGMNRFSTRESLILPVKKYQKQTVKKILPVKNYWKLPVKNQQSP